MNIVVFSTAFLPAFAHGGVPYAAYYLCEALKRRGHEVSVVTSDLNWNRKLDVEKDQWTQFCGIPVAYCTTYVKPYIFAPSMGRIVKSLGSNVDIIVSAGTFWNYPFVLAHRLAQKANVPHVVYPHGLFEPWALRHHSLRKKAFYWLGHRRLIQKSSAIVALNAQEKQSIEAFEPAIPVSIIPNGVSADSNCSILLRSQLTTLFPCLGTSKYAIFMSRIAELKGVTFLIRVWAELNARPESRLVLCGPAEEAYMVECKKLIRELDIKDRVLFLGTVTGEAKALLLKFAECLVLPSYSEGFPMAVLEALAYGTPAIITPECNFSEIQTNRAGAVLARREQDWVTELNHIMSNKNYRDSLAVNTKFVEKYSWASVAEETERLFYALREDNRSCI